MTAMAASKGVIVLHVISSAFAQGGTDAVPEQNVIQAQLDKGQWVYLNGENIAVILPESPVKILLSSDGGMTWKESVVSGSDEMEAYGRLRHNVQYLGGFISYRYYEDAGPDIWWTADGGDAWQKLPVALPKKYEGCRFTPQTPVFDGKEGVYPIAALHDGEEDTIYMYSRDYGLTWGFEPS